MFAAAESRGLNQSDLAELAGCTRAQISRWRAGKREISLPMADRLLAELGIELRMPRKRKA